MKLDFFTATDFGFEIYAECSTYKQALECAPKIMEENDSNSVFIYNRRSGDTPYKIMIIQDSYFSDEVYSTIDISYLYECDFIMQLLLNLDYYFEIARNNVKEEHLQNFIFKKIYNTILSCKTLNTLNVALELDNDCIEIIRKEINKFNIKHDKEFFLYSVKKLLEKKHFDKKEEIRLKMQSPSIDEDEAFKLLIEFEKHVKNHPKIIL